VTVEIKMNEPKPMRWQVNFDAKVDGKDFEICMLVDDDGIEWDNLLLYDEKTHSFDHIYSDFLPDALVEEMQQMQFQEGKRI
jgi:hypothetical protein